MSCPTNTTKIGNLCYPSCPTKQNVSAQDVTVCQSNTPCADQGIGLTADPDNDLICNKPSPTSPSPTCPAGTINFGDMCYIRCPITMVDNLDSCLKRLYTRVGLVPTCPANTFWNGTACVGMPSAGPAWFFIILICLLSILILLSALPYLLENNTLDVSNEFLYGY